ncbi:MAG TPA: ATP-binding protein [Rhizomicrobium sp.]|jgi:PAS domain S-box-containing protein
MRASDADKGVEKRLGESEVRLQSAVSLVGLGCYSWNPQTNALEWDDRLRAMWGLSPGEFVDYETWHAGVHPHDLARVETAIARCIDPIGDGVYDVEYRVIGRHDRIERWVATRGKTEFEAGRAVGFSGVALDITHHKDTELALQRRIDARTQELELVNRQLRAQIEQREGAEAAVRQLQRLDAIGQITSGVAHDFNNLLSVILTNVQLLEREILDPEKGEGLSLIRTSAEHGINLIFQLLAFSRSQRLTAHAINVNDQVAASEDLLHATLEGKVCLRTSLAPDLWAAVADSTQLESIILNLAINGRDAMETGGTLTLETFNIVVKDAPVHTEDPPCGDYVAFVVRDTGSGISENVRSRVFEPFFTTRGDGRGSGLGLSQVFGYAKHCGGGVRIETAVGKGTSVTVFLPRAGAA